MKLKTDWLLFLTIVAMVCIGLVFVYSASAVVAQQRFHKPSTYFFLRQALAAGIGFGALMLLRRYDYRKLKSSQWAFVCLGVVLALLIAVYFADPAHHRWFRLGPVQFQPSELAKPALVIFLSYFVTLRARDINGRHTVVPATMAMIMLAGAVVVADLGTAVVLMATAAAVFYVAGLESRYFRLALAATLVLLAVAIVSTPYRLLRVLEYLDPHYRIVDTIDPGGHVRAYLARAHVTDTGHQARQSKIAVGSGGLFGRGLMHGTQKLFYLPEAHTDFIYAVIGEEAGLVGCFAVLVGFIVLLYRGVSLYWVALDDFGRYLAIGITVSIVFQAFVNMSVVLNLGPTKGIPLPLVSYGGSSLVSTLISLGLLLSISERAR